MQEYTKLNDYNTRGARDAFDEKGDFVADVIDSKLGDAILIAPRSGGDRRKVIELAVEFAKAAPKKEVGYDWSGIYYPVSPKDTVTEAQIRHLDENRSKAGYYIKLTGEGAGSFDAEVSKQLVNVDLFDALVDAIRLSRENGGKTINFTFNSFAQSVRGDSDAEQLESKVHPLYRTANPPQPAEPSAPLPQRKVGKFTIEG